MNGDYRCMSQEQFYQAMRKNRNKYCATGEHPVKSSRSFHPPAMACS